jgi:transposase
MADDGRLFLCSRCRVQVLVCRRCDRGQIYCSGSCSTQARRASVAAAGRRYQASRRGRFAHAARARRYRARAKIVDQPALRPLPTTRFELARWKRARVNIDYHVELDGHYYSVPHRLVRTGVQLRITSTTVEAFAGHQRVAVHAYSAIRGAFTTNPEHMPASHRAHRQWTPAKLIAWGERIGAACGAVVRWQMEHRPHPEQGYRACLGLQRLSREFGAERLEAACARALSIGAPTYRSVASILKSA